MINRKICVATAILAALTVPGCTDSPAAEQARPEVATLQSKPATTTPSAAADDQRPLIRADTSQEEVNKMLNAYNLCLRDQGVPGQDVGRGYWKPTEQAEGGKHRAAFAACHVKNPELAVDRLKRHDYAEYADRFRAYVACVKAAGVEVTPRGDGPFVDYRKEGDAFSRDVWKIEEKCEEQARFE